MKAMNTDNPEYWYLFFKEIKPDLLGHKDVITYVESLKAENKELRKQLKKIKDEI